MYQESSPVRWTGSHSSKVTRQKDRTTGSLPSDLESTDISRKRLSSVPVTLERPSLETDSFWLASPTAMSTSGSGRPPGQSKLEAQLKRIGWLERGEVLDPEWLEGAMAVPTGWTDPFVCRPATQLIEDDVAPWETAWIGELRLKLLPESNQFTGSSSWGKPPRPDCLTIHNPDPARMHSSWKAGGIPPSQFTTMVNAVATDQPFLFTESLEKLIVRYLKQQKSWVSDVAIAAKFSQSMPVLRAKLTFLASKGLVEKKEDDYEWRASNQVKSQKSRVKSQESEVKSIHDKRLTTHDLTYLPLASIRRDGGTQPRAKMDLKHILQLEAQIEEGQDLEPIVAFFDGTDYWLADGFHRCAAYLQQGVEDIGVDVRQGTRREAVLYSVGANSEHKPALPRTRADKERAVMTLLEDPEWQEWSDRAVAQRCKVSHTYVAKLRARQYQNNSQLNSELCSFVTGNVASNKTIQNSELKTPRTAQESEGLERTVRTAHDLEGTSKSVSSSSCPSESVKFVSKHGTIGSMKVREARDTGSFPVGSPKCGRHPAHPLEEVRAGSGSRVPNQKYLRLTEGDIVEVVAGSSSHLKSLSGYWGVVADVNEFSAEVEIWNQTVTLKPENIQSKECDPATKAAMADINERIRALAARGNLDPAAIDVLSGIARRSYKAYLTKTELAFVEVLEFGR